MLFSRLLEGLSVVPVCMNVEQKSAAKRNCHVSLLSVVSDVFEKLVTSSYSDVILQDHVIN